MTTADQIVAEQRVLWSAAPRDWAELAERENEPLYLAMLDAASVGEGTALLDVGCGSGLLLQLAGTRGATLAGIDITPELLELARGRSPQADLRDGDMSALPFGEASFDVVTGANAFQFAPEPALAFAEAARVLKPGGLAAVAVFAEPERNEGTVLHLAMKALVTEIEGEEDGYAPYALSSADGLTEALRDAGLDLIATHEMPVDWRYADVETTLRALFASAGGARSERVVGHERVADALRKAMQPFIGEDGVVTMHNLFRYGVARKPR